MVRKRIVLMSFLLVAVMLMPVAFASEDCFVASHMPEMANEYKALIAFLEKEGDSFTDSLKDDVLLIEKAYSAYLLDGLLAPGAEIGLKHLRWEIPTRKNKLVSILSDGNSFTYIGLFEPADEKWRSPHIIDVDEIEKLTNKAGSDLSFTVIIANQYNTSFVRVSSDEGAYLIPYSANEGTAGLRNGVLYREQDALDIITINMPYSYESAYNEEGEPIGAGGVSSSQTPESSVFPILISAFAIGCALCVAVPFISAKRKAR